MRSRNVFEIAVLLAAAILISYQLFIPPVIGMADNGDFVRFFTAGLDHLPTEYEDKYFHYFNSKYRIVEARRPGPYLSSSEISIRIARLAGVHFIDNRIFDIRLLGAVHTLLYLFGLCLVLVASRPLTFAARLVLAILLLVILTDASYIACFNSFFSEPTVLVSFLLAAGCALLLVTGHRSVRLLLGYFAASAILVTSKPMYAPFALLFAPFGLRLSRLVAFNERLLLSGSLAVLLCAIAAVHYWHTPNWLRESSAYVGIFTESLKHSPTPQQDLIDMGLDPEWARFAGTDPWAADSPRRDPAFKAALMAHVGTTTVPRFYLSRPSRLYALIRRSSGRILTMTMLGYYEKASGRPPLSQPFGLWYMIRDFLITKSAWTVFALFACGVAATVLGLVRASTQTGQDLLVLVGFLTAIALAQFFIPVLVLGGNDLERHLTLFNLVFDAGLILLAVAALQKLSSRTSSLQRRGSGWPRGSGLARPRAGARPGAP